MPPRTHVAHFPRNHQFSSSRAWEGRPSRSDSVPHKLFCTSETSPRHEPSWHPQRDDPSLREHETASILEKVSPADKIFPSISGNHRDRATFRLGTTSSPKNQYPSSIEVAFAAFEAPKTSLLTQPPKATPPCGHLNPTDAR